MKACVYGVGDMGLAVAYGLQKLGFDLHLIETNTKRHKLIEDTLGVRPTELNSMGLQDVVVSCVPYQYTKNVAEHCATLKIPYCDLGGNANVSKGIHKSYGKLIPVFTDLGLAPGYLNIMAEHLCALYPETKNVEMRCGGLPIDPEGSLNYARVFHIDGLRNEYSGMCDIIKNGKLDQAKALNGAVHFEVLDDFFKEQLFCGSKIQTLEAFYTSGCTNVSLQSMLDKGVENFSYKTVRYPGHVKLIKFLMEECKLTRDQFNWAIKNACKETKEDWVWTSVMTDNAYMQKLIVSDHIDAGKWTAMQKGTAFPTAAAAAILAENKQPKVWSYADLPIDKFCKNLETICGDELVFGKPDKVTKINYDHLKEGEY